MTTDSLKNLDDEAAYWVARMDAGQWSDEDETQLQAWLAEEPLRQAALLRAQAAWLSLDRLADRPATRSREVGHFLQRRKLLLAGIGSAAAAAVVGICFLPSGRRYRTLVGEIRHVPLADGSVAVINTASDVEFDLSDRQRTVEVREGEAWFEVAKDPARPFVVKAGDIAVRAVGTAFSVRRRDGGADVLVTEGVVETNSSRRDRTGLRLVAGQRAFISDRGATRVEPAQPSSLARTLAWRQGTIDLSGDSLTSAIGEFNRYNRRQLVLEDARLGDEQFDGTFRIDDPEGFANAVKYALDVPVDLNDPNEIKIGKNQK